MNKENARKIILNAVDTTKPTWSKWDVHWENIDHVFLSRAYDQMGFDNWLFVDLLNKYNIYSIEKIGSILDGTKLEKKYNRELVGSLNSPFYQNMENGTHGSEGKSFYKSAEEFNGRKGAAYFKLLWYMLVACNYITVNYNASFSDYLKSQYADYNGIKNISDEKFFKTSINEWEEFKQHKKPWNELYGVGPNVFDYIMGDIVELKFVKDSYKLDSANERFLEKTGIIKSSELNQANAVKVLSDLNLPHTLREINKGFYTYCSKLHCGSYCFCRDPLKCQDCNVNEICEKIFE